MPNALPVNLISFTGRTQENENHLEWKVVNERNFSHYELEKSINDTEFNLLAQLPASGKNEVSLSFYNDKTPATLSYYRLKMIDNDGSFNYSNVISLHRNLKDFEVKNVYPNPTTNTATIIYDSENDVTINFEITDVLGVNLGTINAEAKSGVNTQIINLSDFPAGIYFITIKNGLNDTIIKRIIKE